MRFFEFEAREIVKRAGIPVTDYGFTTDPAEARRDRRADRRPDGDQVPGADRRADEGRRREVRRHAARRPKRTRARSSPWRSTGTCRAACSSTRRRRSSRSTTPGVVWDGIRKQPVMIFSPVGGIDIEQVAEEQPETVGRRHFSNILPLSRLHGQGGDRRHRRDRLRAQQARADPHATRAAVRGERHGARRDQPARAARRRVVRRARRPHGHGERGARAARQAAGRPRRRRGGDAAGTRGDTLRARRRGRSTPGTTAAWRGTSRSSTATSGS